MEDGFQYQIARKAKTAAYAVISRNAAMQGPIENSHGPGIARM
jgi:hypothetical protein